MVMGIVRPNSGSFQWFGGVRGPEANKRIGALIETPNFYPYLNLIQT
jgi:ABC-type multidrug transport system ATPase subunit